MKCLIIAAGKGTRLKQRGNSKPLVTLLGVPLIERAIRSATEAGTVDFYVVTGFQEAGVRSFLENLSSRLKISITTIFNKDWKKENGHSVLKARKYLHEPFLLLMADHMFDPAIARKLMSLHLNDGEIALAVDKKINNSLVDMEDVTRVKTERDKILNIGKGIADFNGFDTGIFFCTPAIFSALDQSTKKHNDTTLSGAGRILAAEGRFKAVEMNGLFWIDVDDPASFKQAENALLSNLRNKSNDGFVSRYLNRPLSIKISRLLLNFPITANQVSFFSFIVSLISSLFFIKGNAIIGALLIHLSSILDGCDGEIARLKYLQSTFGDFVDAVLDRYADGFIFLGIFYYSLTEIGNREILGIFWSPLIISSIALLAVLGNLMVSYTSAKSVVNFGYRYKGKWIGAGKGRDIRLFQLFIGGMMTYFHPIFALFSLLIVAIQTNMIVIWRTFLSWKWFRKGNSLFLHRIKAVIFDFDGTVANTMPFLTELAIKLMTENYNISKDTAHKKYLETTGLSFEAQIEVTFPQHPNNQKVVTTFESIKQKEIYSHSVFPDAIPTLKYFKNKKIRTFVCSSTKQEIISSYIKLNKFEYLLDGFFGYKPDFVKSEQIDYVLQHYNLQPKDVLFVGDSLKDFDFAKDKKINFIGIARIFQQKDFRKTGGISVLNLNDIVKLFGEHEKHYSAFDKV